MKDLKTIYSERATQFKEIAAALEKKYNYYAIVRLIAFFIGVGILIFLYTTNVWAGLIATVLMLIAFARFVFWHQAIQKQRRHNEKLHTINQQELASLQHDYSAFGSGAQFNESLHPYSIDLDIFGDYSFFQYCNRTVTALGEIRLADYFKQAASRTEITARQEAVKALKGQLDWRQNFQALGLETEDNVAHIRALNKWLEEPPFVSNNKRLIAAIRILPFLILPTLMLLLYLYPWQVAILILIIPALIIRRTLKQVGETHVQTADAEKILAYYALLIDHIEKEDFESKKLQDLKQAFIDGEGKASKQIGRLSFIIRQLNVRYNVFAILLNLFGLWDLQYVYQLEKWKASQKDKLGGWFEALQEFEAILSLATVYYNNSDWVFPEITTDQSMKAVQLGHPLIEKEKRISNDMEMPTRAHIKLITGSNMAGKSTFLRTIGLNIVMAMAGMPVCAGSFRLPLLQVYSSMRTQDALHESTSSFYAELKRLKIIIEAVEESAQNEALLSVFFLLDEILKGTNSNDRHTGSKALINQFIKSKGAGLIATHDLELGNMEANAAGAIENLCMEVEVEDGNLIFDYTIKKGVSQSFNATTLMRNMGIKID